VVVLQEADEDAGEDPRHRHLIQVVLPPDLIRLGRPTSLLDLCERQPQTGIDLGIRRRTSKEILVQFLDKFLQIRQECLDIDHD